MYRAFYDVKVQGYTVISWILSNYRPFDEGGDTVVSRLGTGIASRSVWGSRTLYYSRQMRGFRVQVISERSKPNGADVFADSGAELMFLP